MIRFSLILIHFLVEIYLAVLETTKHVWTELIILCLRVLNFESISHNAVPKIRLNFQPTHKAIFSAVDQDQDGILTKEEQRNHINTVRDTMGINYQSGPPGRAPGQPPGSPPRSQAGQQGPPGRPGPRSPPGRPGPTTPMPPPRDRNVPREMPAPTGRDRPIPPGRDRPIPQGRPDPMHNYKPPGP